VVCGWLGCQVRVARSIRVARSNLLPEIQKLRPGRPRSPDTVFAPG
jgi:hypothetical protein